MKSKSNGDTSVEMRCLKTNGCKAQSNMKLYLASRKYDKQVVLKSNFQFVTFEKVTPKLKVLSFTHNNQLY